MLTVKPNANALHLHRMFGLEIVRGKPSSALIR